MNPMRLTLSTRHDGRTLQARYALTNDTGVDVYVQHLTAHNAIMTRPYVYHVPPDQVVLWSGTPPCVPERHHPPPSMHAVPPVPWAQRLSPGESLDVSLRLPLPLSELDLWYHGKGPVEAAWANVIRFRLDVHIKRRGLRVGERQGSYWITDTPVVLEASTTIDPPIPVHSYGELFHRAGLA